MSNTHEPSFQPLRLETPRLILRHFQASDVPTLLAYRNDPEVARYQGWSSLTEAEAKAFIEAQRVRPVAAPHAWLQIAFELMFRRLGTATELFQVWTFHHPAQFTSLGSLPLLSDRVVLWLGG